MAELGIDLLTSQLLGRWGSNMVLRYVAEVLLSAITRRVIEKFDTASLADIARGGDFDEKTEEFKKDIASSKEELVRMKGLVGAKQVTDKFVVNEALGVTHALASCLGPTSGWVTKCGWCFVKSRTAVITQSCDSAHQRCGTCFRRQGESDHEHASSGSEGRRAVGLL